MVWIAPRTANSHRSQLSGWFCLYSGRSFLKNAQCPELDLFAMGCVYCWKAARVEA